MKLIKHFSRDMWRIWHSCDIAGAITIKWNKSAHEVARQWNGTGSKGLLHFARTWLGMNRNV